ncbi:single-stranded DNA-binding protein [bacterium]|nr:MAG: single-stranded DNA-binding protein [bacterium]
MDTQFDPNKDVNYVMLVGTLPRDPIFKNVGANATPLVNFTVMTTRKWVDPTTQEPKTASAYHNVVAWRDIASAMNGKLKMGTRVKVKGELTSRSWVDQSTGQKQYKTEVSAQEVLLLGDSDVALENNNDSTNDVNVDDLPF